MCQATRSSIARVTGRSFPPVPRLAATATIVAFLFDLEGSSEAQPELRLQGEGVNGLEACRRAAREATASRCAACISHRWVPPPGSTYGRVRQPAATAQRGDSLRLKSQRPSPPPPPPPLPQGSNPCSPPACSRTNTFTHDPQERNFTKKEDVNARVHDARSRRLRLWRRRSSGGYLELGVVEQPAHDEPRSRRAHVRLHPVPKLRD